MILELPELSHNPGCGKHVHSASECTCGLADANRYEIFARWDVAEAYVQGVEDVNDSAFKVLGIWEANGMFYVLIHDEDAEQFTV